MTATGVAVRPFATVASPSHSEGLLPNQTKLSTPPTTPPQPAAPKAPAEPISVGLRHDDLNAYPPVDTSDLEADAVPLRLASAAPVRGLSAAQFAAMYDQYRTLDVRHETVFPFLYCGHNGSAAQNQFFHASTDAPNAPPYRGLTIVRVPDAAEDPEPRQMESRDNDTVRVPPPPPHAALMSSLAPEELLCDVRGVAPHDACFRHQPSSSKVSMRNFQAQSVNYALISDVVVYSPHGATDAARATALAFRYAQQRYYHERVLQRLGGLRYNVFLITEPFAALEKACPELIAVDMHGRPRQLVDFLLREQEEMYHMATASRIDTNVYLGPSYDFQPNVVLPQDAPYEGAPTFSIGLEAFECSKPPSPEFLRTATRSLASFDREVALGRHVQVPTVHLECPAGTAPRSSHDQMRAVASDVLTLCAWLQAHTSPEHCRYPRAARRALIHCADGYTESSVFALAYLMYAHGLSLARAYLELQLSVERSFFVFRKDLALLRLIEAQTRLLHHALPDAPHAPEPEPERDWLGDENFDGSLPSRILPFLYLGNLGHARNARLLHALGITHVVSVGERASSDEEAATSPHSLGAAQRAGRVKVHNVANVNDNGTDSLRAVMCDAVSFIERARKSGGRVLVHCRIGVSRSSTIVLAYVMAHLDISLIDAYLLVRSRRLNVLIQPHPLFFWELCGWETSIAARQGRIPADAGTKHGAPRIALGEGRGRYGLTHSAYAPAGVRRVTWSFLCREIAALNARYCVDDKT